MSTARRNSLRPPCISAAREGSCERHRSPAASRARRRSSPHSPPIARPRWRTRKSDDGGNLMYLERLDNTFAAGARISIGKARTAALFKKPTAAFEEIIRNGRTPMIALEDFTPLQGGVPLELDGKVIGAIGVSGAANQQRDEEVAKAGAAALK
ncbi:MAG: heme-binding protein [Deltaproteobacteria bacterium]|nr:MAG: heme-binding protein [Deltaproteobacteria bacterium]